MESQDSVLVRRVRDGDLRAFTELDSTYREMAHQLALGVVGNPFEADDVVQEALFRAFERIDQLSDPARFGAWLRSIIRNIAIDHVRLRFRRNEHTTDIEDLDRQLFSHLFLSEESGRHAISDELLSKLSPALAEVVRLRVIERLKLSEIAKRLRIPLGTVKRRMYDAKRNLRRITMKSFDSSAAWSIVEKAKNEIANLDEGLRRDIIGIAVGGDLPREDFAPNNSGLLVCPLISNRENLNLYETSAFQAVTHVFDNLCKPYEGCAESPTVWENLAIDEIHLPTSAERFEPPTIPQPQWYSMFLFDLIDHHHMIYGNDFIADLYRPDPRTFTLRMASSVLQLLKSGKASPHPPVGFGTVVHWQVRKMVRLLQLHFSPGEPTIMSTHTLKNYTAYVPEFPTKKFGADVFHDDMALRYPADRKEYSDAHAAKCRTFISDCCALLIQHQNYRS